jgi:sugar/nucleoside kinase (ribokinase family)
LVDVTGAGDALAAGTLSGLLEDLPLAEALKRGAALAALTLSSSHAVAPEVNRERLETMVGLVAQARHLA